ncbi:MAG TPA: hypothetical protein PLV49_04270 [Methanothrix soehngenii]|jgi:hypothetical protein|nr:hypothetical protein [Methanothrix soehngenii]
MEESEIKAIKLILAVLALGLLVAVGAAFEDYGGSHHHGGPSDGYHDFGGFYDWLSPGAYYYSYSYYPTYTYYPTYYYPTYYYPTYTPVYTYTAPVVYDPVVYDPWWAANVYGLGATTYYYSSSWSWSSYHGGYYFR